MSKESTKRAQSGVIKLSLLAGAAGSVGHANAAVVSTDLGVTAFGNYSPVYFSYSAGVISSSNSSNAVSAVWSIIGGKWPQTDTMLYSEYSNSHIALSGALAQGTAINSSLSWDTQYMKFGGYQNGFYGVRFKNGSDWNYGWVDVSWTPAGTSVHYGRAAVETTVNTAILAGLPAVPTAVPEAGGVRTVSLVAGVLTMVKHRRRQRRAVAA